MGNLCKPTLDDRDITDGDDLRILKTYLNWLIAKDGCSHWFDYDIRIDDFKDAKQLYLVCDNNTKNLLDFDFRESIMVINLRKDTGLTIAETNHIFSS
jgi:hypothetical protein